MADSPILSSSLLQEISPFSILKHIPSHETDFLPGPHPLFSNSHLLICNCMLNSNSLQEHNRERGRISYPSLFATHISLI